VDRSLVTVSKFLAKHLRHAPDALGLTLQPGGWCWWTTSWSQVNAADSPSPTMS